MESLENNNHSSHNQVSNWTKNDNLLYSDITCCNAGLHYSMCLAWISCITSSSWTLRCTVHYLYWQVYSPPTNICTGQNTTTQQGITGWYYITTAAMQYSTMPVRPCSCRVYKQEEPQTPPQSSTCSHTENLNLKNQITTDSGVPNAAKIIRRCQDCQGPQVVIDERGQGTLSNWTLVVRMNPH